MRIADPYVDELTSEASTTRRVLERVPEAHLNWPPWEVHVARAAGPAGITIVDSCSSTCDCSTNRCHRSMDPPMMKTRLRIL